MPFDTRPFGREMDPVINPGLNKTLRQDPHTDGWTFLFGSFAQPTPKVGPESWKRMNAWRNSICCRASSMRATVA